MYKPLLVKSIQVILLVPILVSSWSLAIRQLQKSNTQCTVYIGHLHIQCSVICRIQILTNYIFSPRTSIYSKKAAIDSAFDYPLYRGRVAVVYGVFHMVALCAFTAFFHYRFHSVSAHLMMYIVDLYLCWWPPSLYCCGSTLLAWHWVSAQCCSSSYISCSLSAACRCSVFQLIYLGVLSFRRGLAPYIYFSTQCISFFTGCPYTVVALYIAVMSIQMLSSGTAASHSIIACGVRLQTPVILHRY